MKLFPILLAFLLFVPFVYAETIYEYLRGVDENYNIVVGELGRSSDSLAATTIILAFERDRSLSLPVVLESSVSQNENKILIGHPCTNSLIKLSCDGWPYLPGQAIIQVLGNDLIIAGSADEDTMAVARIVADYKNYPLLQQESAVIYLQFPALNTTPQLIPMKRQYEFVCGDQVCEPGERFLCQTDCGGMNCFQFCQSNEFINAECRDVPSNPNVPICKEGWVNYGTGYCATSRVCCCEPPTEQAEQEQNATSVPNEEQVRKKSFFRSIIEWFIELFRAVF